MTVDEARILIERFEAKGDGHVMPDIAAAYELRKYGDRQDATDATLAEIQEELNKARPDLPLIRLRVIEARSRITPPVEIPDPGPVGDTDRFPGIDFIPAEVKGRG